MSNIDTGLYVVGGYKNGKFGTVGFDDASGGYPYFDPVLRDKTSSLESAKTSWLEDAKSSYVGITDAKVYRIVLEEVKPERVKCPNKDQSGNCPLHNLHCQYPNCENT